MVGEDRAGGDGKGMVAIPAVPLLPIFTESMFPDHTTARTGNFFASPPAHFLEHRKGFLVRHPGDLEDGQGAGFGGEKEVLFHGGARIHTNVCANDTR